MEKEIGKINKNDITDIVLRVDDFNDRRGLTIREFIRGERYTGFTKSGVRILAPDFAKFKEMINSIPEEDMIDPNLVGGQQEVPSETQQAPAEQPSENSKSLPDY